MKLTTYQKGIIDECRLAGLGTSIDSGTYDKPSVEYIKHLISVWEGIAADCPSSDSLRRHRQLKSLRKALSRAAQ